MMQVWWKNQDYMKDYALPSAVGLPSVFGLVVGAQYLTTLGMVAQASAGAIGGGGVQHTTANDHKMKWSKLRRSKTWFRDRILASLVVWLDVFSLIALTKGFQASSACMGTVSCSICISCEYTWSVIQAIICIRNSGGEWRLFAEQSIMCWSRAHMPMYVPAASLTTASIAQLRSCFWHLRTSLW